MKINEYVLSNNEVIYINNPTIDNYSGREFNQPFMRIENIDGKLYETILPNYFLVENDILSVTLDLNSNTTISAANSTEDILIQKKNIDDSLQILHVIKDIHLPDSTASQYADYIGTLQNNRSFDVDPISQASYFLEIILNAIDLFDLNESILINNEADEINNLIFKKFSKSREARLNSLENSNN